MNIDIKTGMILSGPDKKIPVSEVFGPTIQGEGALTGQISYFLRVSGCDYRCSWCDSMHAVDPVLIKENSTYMTQLEIINKVRNLTKKAPLHQWLTVSGGNPLIWDLSEVAIALRLDEMKLAVETQGSFIPDWLKYIDLITVSPKPPSSGMHERTDYNVLDKFHQLTDWRKRVVLKVVIFTYEDLMFAQNLKDRYPETQFHLSVGTDVNASGLSLNAITIARYRWLANEVLKQPGLWGSVVSPQMHVLLWGHEKGK